MFFFFSNEFSASSGIFSDAANDKKNKNSAPRFQREDLVSLYIAGEALKASSKLYKANRAAAKLNTLHASARVMTPPAVVNVPVRAGGRLTGL